MNVKMCFRILATILFSATSLIAQIKLPRVISDNMVLQRQREVKIWGWARPGESVEVSFNGQKVKTKAGSSGNWTATLKPMQHGGPYQMKISGKSNAVTLNNILVGDVWLGSGQSNMEWIMKNTQNADKEIAAANYPKIRLFTVNKDQSFSVKPDVASGQWQECSPQTAINFSAVAYYFGLTLHRELDVPIGLISSSWGGTKVEPWISWDQMKQEEEYKNVDLPSLERKGEDEQKRRDQYEAALKADKGITEKWFDPQTSLAGWKKMELPRDWTNTEVGHADGIVYFRKDFQLSQIPSGEVSLSLGPIDDNDVTWINGIEVGATNAYNTERLYPVKSGVLRQGTNTIVVKVVDTGGGGGLYGKPEQLFLSAGESRIPLAGEWQYRPSVLNSDFNLNEVGPNAYPSRLFNAMIAPLIPFSVRGVIWYQGESNTYAAYNYRRLFPMLINNWRSKWGYEFPFYWVQLANYMPAVEQPSESNWAELREAQTMTLSLPKTGQAVIIDIGEANDIHPRNKKDVGYRLALNALAKEYGKNIVFSGPVYKSMEVTGDKVVLTFDAGGSSLSVRDKYGYLKGFAVAGADKKFYWAKARLEGDKVVVQSPSVSQPVAVRYGWAHNPDDLNLYNKEGLPASPFRTDTWKLTTEN